MPDSGSQASTDHRPRNSVVLCRTQRLMGAAGLLLLACSWKLWTPQTVFPQIPFFSWAVHAPPAIDWLSLLLLIVCSLALMFAPSAARSAAGENSLQMSWALYGLILGFVVQVCLDQQRAQVWCYQLGLFAAVLVAASHNARAILSLRWIVVGLYLHSSLSKCDHSFVNTYGQQLIETLLSQIGLTLQFQSELVRRCLAATLPVTELCIACGLVFPRSRRISLIGATAMHTLLLVSLGPSGLNHHATVLVWNAYFLMQVWILFGRVQTEPETGTSMISAMGQMSLRDTPRNVACLSLIAVAILLPFAEPWGYLDHWPAWALYASRTPRVKLLVNHNARERLTADQRRHLEEPRAMNDRYHMNLQRWTLDELDVPIYPQRRFQLAVMLALVRTHDLDSAIRIEEVSAADRWTGHRSMRLIESRQQLAAECRTFLINTQPRSYRE